MVKYATIEEASAPDLSPSQRIEDTKYFSPKVLVSDAAYSLTPDDGIYNKRTQPRKGQKNILMSWAGTCDNHTAIMAPGVSSSSFMRMSFNPSKPNFPSYSIPRGNAPVTGGLIPK